MQLSVFNEIPSSLLEKPASALHQQLPGPSLVTIPGKDPRPLFISVLQHGNEDTGWEAVRRLVKHRYAVRELPRSILLFIGNVKAAQQGVRRLDNQPDFNRCWPYPGRSSMAENDYSDLFAQVTRIVQADNPVAAIDIHNNTGMNPHYAAINHLNPQHYNLARLFSEMVVYFQTPKGTLASAFGEFCPSITIECGQAGRVHGTDHAMDYLEQCMHLDSIDNTMPHAEDDALHHMLATVYVSTGLSFSFMPEQSTLSFVSNLDRYNFKELPSGTLLAHLRASNTKCLLALDHDAQDITDKCFSFNDGMVRTKRTLMPSMLTPNAQVIRQDCLCYLMEKWRFNEIRQQPPEDLTLDNVTSIGSFNVA